MVDLINENENYEFKLVVEYSCILEDDEEWTVTGNKKLFTKIYTKGLPEGKKVWLNDIHTDTSIMASIKQFDGITQDTMDDGVHNSTLTGFAISDDTCYYGVNAIEGQNDQFIQGFVHGHNGYSNGSIEQRRFLESDYLEAGVFANKITSIYGLLGKDETKDVIYGIDVLSELKVNFCNRVLFVDSKTGNKYYTIYETSEDGIVNQYTESVGSAKKLN